MGLLYYRNCERRYREMERQLSAIAELKVDDLVRWRAGSMDAQPRVVVVSHEGGKHDHEKKG